MLLCWFLCDLLQLNLIHLQTFNSEEFENKFYKLGEINTVVKRHSQIHICEDVTRSIENTEEAAVFYYEPTV